VPTPQQALDYAKRFIGNIPVDDSAMNVRILDSAHKRLWMRAPWRWTVGMLEPAAMVNGQQEINLVATAADLSYLLHARVVNTDNPHDLQVVSHIPENYGLISGRPSQIAFVSGTPQKLRLSPSPSGYTTLPTIFSAYKRTATELTSGNIGSSYSTLAGVPDDWFWVYEEMVLLRALQFVNSPRAGSVTVNGNQAQYTGQMGVVEAAIQEMLAHEKKFFDSLGGPVNG
jgi:hypothetical protein